MIGALEGGKPKFPNWQYNWYSRRPAPTVNGFTMLIEQVLEPYTESITLLRCYSAVPCPPHPFYLSIDSRVVLPPLYLFTLFSLFPRFPLFPLIRPDSP